MTERSPFDLGKSAGYCGTPRSDNPFLKGLAGPHLAWAEEWNNGYHAGKALALQDIMVKHLASLSEGFNADNLE